MMWKLISNARRRLGRGENLSHTIRAYQKILLMEIVLIKTLETIFVGVLAVTAEVVVVETAVLVEGTVFNPGTVTHAHTIISAKQDSSLSSVTGVLGTSFQAVSESPSNISQINTITATYNLKTTLVHNGDLNQGIFSLQVKTNITPIQCKYCTNYAANRRSSATSITIKLVSPRSSTSCSI